MKKAFSLIEVLMAIMIFTVGFLAIQRMVMHSIRTADKIKIQTESSMLAAQAMQTLLGIRNTNILRGLPRDCAQPKEIIDTESCEIPLPIDTSQALKIAMKKASGGTDANPYMQIALEPLADDFATDFANFRLYYHTGSVGSTTPLEHRTRYDHDPTDGIATNYARYMTFQPVDDGANPAFDTDYVLQAQAVILFQKGATTGQIVMESIIGKIQD